MILKCIKGIKIQVSSMMGKKKKKKVKEFHAKTYSKIGRRKNIVQMIRVKFTQTVRHV